MRKELVYSLMAVGGAFPITVSAAAVNADQPKETGWTDNTDTTADDGIVKIAVGETKNIVSLLPGNYTLKLKVTSAKKVTLTVKGGKEDKSVEIAAGASKDGEVTFDVTGTEAKNIEIGLASEAAEFTLSDVNVKLNFDFAKKVENLWVKWGVLVNTVDTYTYTDKTDDMVAYTAAIGNKLEAIREADDKTGYKLYTDYKLYLDEPDPLASLNSALDDALNVVKGKEIEFKADKLQETYNGDDIKKAFDKLSATAQAQANGKDEALGDKDGKITMTSVQADIDAFRAGSSVDDSKVKANMNILKNKIAKAAGADAANIAAYKAVTNKANGEFDAKGNLVTPGVKQTYTAAFEAIANNLVGDDYKALREEANKLLTAENGKIQDVLAKAKASYDKGESVAKQAGYEAELATIDAAIQKIQNDYVAAQATVKAVLDKVATLQKALDDAKAVKATAAAIAADENVAADAKAAQDLIDRLTKKVTNPAKADVDDANSDFNKALTNEEYGETAINNAIAKLTTGDNRKNYDSYTAISANLANLQKAFDAAVAEVAAYAKNAKDDKTLPGMALAESDYNPATYWKLATDYLQKSITAEVEALAKDYKDGKAATHKDITGDVTTAVNNYKTQAKNAAKEYATYSEKAADYQKKLDDLTKKVKDLMIYENDLVVGGVKTVTNYKKQIADIQKDIKTLTDALADAKKSVGHNDFLKKLTDVATKNHWTGYNGPDKVNNAEVHHTGAAELAGKHKDVTATIKNLSDNAEADNAAWIANNEKEAIAALEKTATDLQQELNDAIDKLNTETANNDKYGLGTKNVKDQTDEIDNERPTDADVTAAVTATTGKLEGLTELVAKLNESKAALDALLNGDAKAAAASKAANDKAIAAAAKTFGELQTKYDKEISTQADQYSDDKVKSAWKKDAEALTETAIAGKKIDSVDKLLKEFTAIQDSITALNGAKSKYALAAAKEQLTADVYADDLASLKSRINLAVAAADAAQANLKAWQDVDAEAAKVATAITDGIAAAKKEDASTEAANLADNILGKKYNDALNKIKDDSKKAYSGAQSVESKSALLDRLKDLKALADKMAADVKANLAAKKEQDKAYNTVDALWSKVYTEISESDESSQLPTWQEELAAQKEEILKVKDQIKNDYENGNSVDNGVIEKITEITAAINTIQQKSKDNYDARIGADNDNMHKAFIAAVEDAQDAYNAATNSIKAYSDLESQLLINALAGANIDIAGLSADLNKYPGQLKTLKEKEAKDYLSYTDGTKPAGSVFDKDSAYVNDARNYQKQIEAFEQAFLDKITASIKGYVEPVIAQYKADVDAAKAENLYKYDEAGNDLTDTEDETVATLKKSLLNKLFRDANNLISDIEVAYQDVDLESLDDALLAAEDDGLTPDPEGVALAIFLARNNGADITLNVDLTVVNDSADWLTQDVYKFANVATLLNDFVAAKAIKNIDEVKTAEQLIALYNADKAANKLAAQFTKWEDALKDLTTDIRNAKNSDVAYNDLKAALDYLQAQLDAVTAEAQKYVAYQDLKTYQLDGIQGWIDWIAQNAATEANNHNAATYKKNLETSKDLIYKDGKTTGNILDLINAAKLQNLFNYEYALLTDNTNETGMLKKLNDQYVLYAAGFDNEEDVAAKKAKIDGWKKTLTDNAANSINKDLSVTGKADRNKFIIANYKDQTKFPYADLLAELLTIQNDMAALLTEMAAGTTENPDSKTTAAVYEDLSAQIAVLEAVAALSDYDDNVKAVDAVKDAKAEADEAIAEVKGLVETNKDNILIFADEYQELIDAAENDVKNLTNAAKNAQTDLANMVEDINKIYGYSEFFTFHALKYLNEAKAEIDGYTFVKADNYSVKFDQVEDELLDLVDAIATKKANALGKMDLNWWYNGAKSGRNEAWNVENEALNMYYIPYWDNDAVPAWVWDAKASCWTAPKGFDVWGGSAKDAIDDVLNSAAKRELKNELAELQVSLDAIVINAENYTLGDYDDLTWTKQNIQNQIYNIVGDGKDNAGYFEYLGNTYHNELQSTPKFDPAKPWNTGINTLQDRIAYIAYQIGQLALNVDEFNQNPVDKKSYDFNGDGDIDISDYGKLVEEVENQTNDPKYDLNGDGKVNISDLRLWVAYLQSLSEDTAARNIEEAVASMEVLGTENGVTRLAINLNSADNFFGMQVDIQANVVAASTSSRVAEGMGLYKGNNVNGTTRVFLSSFYGKEIAAGEGAVLYLDVTNFNGNAEGIFVNMAGQTVTFNLGTGEVTAINGVATNQSFSEKVYNLGGKLMNGLKKGLNIIRNSDGTSKKVVVK